MTGSEKPRPLWTGADIAAATGGLCEGDFSAFGVSFDSREVREGDLFVAMRGEQSDGHRFLPQALSQGASGCLVEQAIASPHVLVPDSFKALEALGVAARGRSHAKIIGVTGSVGKTGTKEALRQMFARVAPEGTHSSVKSYNNHVGVPLSLARMPADCRYGVFEMGMSHKGEIAALTAFVRPHVALITWVAPAHIEHFPDGEVGIANAKAEIFQGVEPGGFGLYPADNPHSPLLQQAIAERGLDSLSFGWSRQADIRVLSAEIGPDGSDLLVDVAGEQLRCRVGMAGRHWVSNACAVLAVAKAAGVSLAVAAESLAQLQDLPGRGARFSLPVAGGSALVIDESYNANPVSMAATLAVLGDIPAKRRLAVLGAMRELGADSAERHAALAAPIKDAAVEAVALVGPEMAALKTPGACHVADWAAALQWVKGELQAGDVLLVKGSNSVGLGALVAALRDGL